MLPITFLSDYGLEDEFVGVCHAVIARIVPDAKVIDLSHGIARHDVAQGAAVLAGALAYAPAGVHLAVVDPGVGSRRRAVALRTAEGRLLVGPDNGLLGPAAERFGGIAEAVDISASAVRLEPLSATFHGRDLFAPVAAHLARGAPLAALGERFDPAALATLSLPAAKLEAGRIATVVSHADGFGNLALALDAGQLATLDLEAGARIEVEAGEITHAAVYATTFAELAAGTLLLYLDAAQRPALAVNKASAAELLRVGAGDPIVINRA